MGRNNEYEGRRNRFSGNPNSEGPTNWEGLKRIGQDIYAGGCRAHRWSNYIMRLLHRDLFAKLQKANLLAKTQKDLFLKAMPHWPRGESASRSNFIEPKLFKYLREVREKDALEVISSLPTADEISSRLDLERKLGRLFQYFALDDDEWRARASQKRVGISNEEYDKIKESGQRLGELGDNNPNANIFNVFHTLPHCYSTIRPLTKMIENTQKENK